MKTRILFVTLIMAFIFTSTSTLCAQGKLFTKEEAEEKFGKVVEMVPMSLERFQALLDANPATDAKVGKKLVIPSSASRYRDTIMFRIVDTDIVILDGMRRSIYNPTSKDFVKQGQMEFKVYARELVETLVRDGGGDRVMFEIRESGVFSISCGIIILDDGEDCPPACPDPK
ncbi:MAG: hypothetical protein GY940_36990 [bacterium]|nr:hypothetical protein [bacterium]